MPFRWSARATQTVSAAAMSALLMASAMKHFREPRFFEQVVPDYLCREAPIAGGQSPEGREIPATDGVRRPLAVMSRREWIAVSGLLEAGAAVGLLIPGIRRATATAVTAMFTVFLAGHVDALRRAYGPAGSPAQRNVHAVRLPLQLPLILWAWSLRKPGRRR
ncbi:DoxX family protein [Pseudarthrobacter sp. S3]|uniref:DoxX family protein n=1 Tax=Pseudarthrobacter sp. S3 TaxID=3418419 RepID=UPI003CEB0AFC